MQSSKPAPGVLHCPHHQSRAMSDGHTGACQGPESQLYPCYQPVSITSATFTPGLPPGDVVLSFRVRKNSPGEFKLSLFLDVILAGLIVQEGLGLN